ncbi:kinase-like protein, partial [Fistulina hepatica ATCC 64428]
MAQLPTCIPDLSGHSVDDGRFFLKRCLGIGGYGRVYLAVDITSGVRYAVKCQIRAAPGSSRAGFQRAETVIHEAVSGHPNIITFHRVIELSSAEREFYGDLVFFVMDLCDGPDLFDMIMNKAFAQNDELVRHVFLKLVDAVFHCHQNGVFHRDIKPENILVSKDTEKVHLTDFGLATTSLFSSEIGVGSHNYMAPECIGSAGFRRDRVFHRFTDIWSLGVMLSTMVTGRMPWHRASMSDKHFKAYFHNRYYLEQSLPGMSKPAHRLLRQMLALEPADRIPLADLRRRVFNMQTFF